MNEQMADGQKGIAVRLKERRELLRASLEDIAKDIGVPAKHLRRIERGDWEALPSAVYTKGFVRKYARALGMDAGRLVQEYEREAAHIKEARTTARSRNKTGRIRALLSVFSISATRRIAVGIIFLAVLGYIGYQLSIVFADPALTVSRPAAAETVVTESTTVLTGTTDPGATLLLNNQQVEVGPDGTFQKEVELLPGINVLEITAVSRFDERTSVRRTVIFQEPERPLFPSQQEQGDPSPAAQTENGNNATVGTTTATSSPNDQ